MGFGKAGKIHVSEMNTFDVIKIGTVQIKRLLVCSDCFGAEIPLNKKIFRQKFPEQLVEKQILFILHRPAPPEEYRHLQVPCDYAFRDRRKGPMKDSNQYLQNWNDQGIR